MKRELAMLLAAGVMLGAMAEKTPIQLENVTTDITVGDWDVLTGTLKKNKKISIAADAWVILRNATIEGTHSDSYPWAGLTCLGNATILIDGTNDVHCFGNDYPAIYVPVGKTLTIRQAVNYPDYQGALGGGTLKASNHGNAAGIGAGRDTPCGNIVIKSGIITAEGKNSAAIGGATGITGGHCGNITIEGGVVQATGGRGFAGIGGGIAGVETVVNCGDIYIGPDVTLVSATAGNNCETPIGACTTGTVVVELAEGATDTTDDNSPPTRTIEGTAAAQQYANGVAWDFRIVNGGAEICEMYYTSDGEEHYRAAIDTGTTGALVIPDTLGGKPVTRIGNSAFLFCRKITSVTIPASVTSIGESAFYYCEALTDATMPVGVTTIEVRAFEGCDSLTSVTIPGSVKSIGESAFEDCDVLTSVTITDGVEIIGERAFRYCTALTGITIPASVKTVGQSVFENCTSLATLDVSDGTTIEEGAFHNCNALADANGFVIIRDVLHQYIGGDADVTVPPGITRIGGMAFAQHSSLPPPLGAYPKLVRVTIPDSVTSIGSMAFALCAELENVMFPAKMPRVEDGAFGLCVKLADAAGFIIIGGALHSYIGTASVLTIPAGVTSLGPTSFMTYTGMPPDYYGLSPVTSLTIPSGVTNIMFSAFGYCPMLTTVSIPSSVTSIGEGAFFDMYGGKFPLQTVHVEAGDTERVKGLLVASGHLVDYITWVEDYKPAPAPGGCYQVLSESDITVPYAAPKAVTLAGAVYDGCDVVGIVNLRLGKVNAKKKTGKVSGAVTLLDGKKRTIKSVSVTGIDGVSPKSVALSVKGLGTMNVTIGGTRFAGSLGGYHVQSAAVGGKWTRADAKVYVAFGGAALPAGTIEDLLPDGEPVIPRGGKWAFGKASSVKYAKDAKTKVLTLTVNDRNGTARNRSAMKLSYNPKTGVFKGSFKVYAIQGGKLKKITAKVNGVVADGDGHGRATIQKSGVFPVTVE